MATAVLAPTAEARAPIWSAPSGPNPMASISTPIARPRIASDALVSTRLLCMVAKHAIPVPAKNSSTKERRYHPEKENSITAVISRTEPIANRRPLCLTFRREATTSEALNAPRPSAASRRPVSCGPSPSTCLAMTGTMFW